MKSTKEIRRLNMVELIKADYKGSQSAFAAVVGQQSSVISRAVNTESVDHRGIGNKFARSIEEKLKLPINWMDNEHEGLTLVSSNDEPYKASLNIMALVWVDSFVSKNITKEMMEVRDAEWKARMFAALYDLYIQDKSVKSLNDSTVMKLIKL